MKIEAVSVNDAEELLAIYAPYVEGTAISFEYEVPSLEEFKSRIENISSILPYLKICDDSGVILGYAYAGKFKTRKAYDWSVETTIYIKSDCRRSGVGSLLYEKLEAILREMGIINLNACIAVPQENDPYLTDASQKFHARHGYELVGTFHKSGYKFDNWYDMIWMEKIIGEHGKNQPAVEFGDWKKYI